jgi:hypothetical protein
VFADFDPDDIIGADDAHAPAARLSGASRAPGSLSTDEGEDVAARSHTDGLLRYPGDASAPRRERSYPFPVPLHVFVLSSDKDMMQVVGPHASLLRLGGVPVRWREEETDVGVAPVEAPRPRSAEAGAVVSSHTSARDEPPAPKPKRRSRREAALEDGRMSYDELLEEQRRIHHEVELNNLRFKTLAVKRGNTVFDADSPLQQTVLSVLGDAPAAPDHSDASTPAPAPAPTPGSDDFLGFLTDDVAAVEQLSAAEMQFRDAQQRRRQQLDEERDRAESQRQHARLQERLAELEAAKEAAPPAPKAAAKPATKRAAKPAKESSPRSRANRAATRTGTSARHSGASAPYYQAPQHRVRTVPAPPPTPAASENTTPAPATAVAEVAAVESAAPAASSGSGSSALDDALATLRADVGVAQASLRAFDDVASRLTVSAPKRKPRAKKGAKEEAPAPEPDADAPAADDGEPVLELFPGLADPFEVQDEPLIPPHIRLTRAPSAADIRSARAKLKEFHVLRVRDSFSACETLLKTARAQRDRRRSTLHDWAASVTGAVDDAMDGLLDRRPTITSFKRAPPTGKAADAVSASMWAPAPALADALADVVTGKPDLEVFGCAFSAERAGVRVPDAVKDRETEPGYGTYTLSSHVYSFIPLLIPPSPTPPQASAGRTPHSTRSTARSAWPASGASSRRRWATS